MKDVLKQRVLNTAKCPYLLKEGPLQELALGVLCDCRQKPSNQTQIVRLAGLLCYHAASAAGTANADTRTVDTPFCSWDEWAERGYNST